MGRTRNPATLNKLLDEGMAAFLHSGYHGTGIKEVLDRVNVPKGSFYTYFESKEAFAAAVVEHYAACFANRMQAHLSVAANPLAGLRAFFESLMVEFEANQYTGGCLVANLGGELEGSDLCRSALSAAFTGWSREVAAILEASQQQGLVRTDIEASTLADLLTEAWEGAVIRMKIEHSLEPLRRVLTQLLDGYIAA